MEPLACEARVVKCGVVRTVVCSTGCPCADEGASDGGVLGATMQENGPNNDPASAQLGAF